MLKKCWKYNNSGWFIEKMLKMNRVKSLFNTECSSILVQWLIFHLKVNIVMNVSFFHVFAGFSWQAASEENEEVLFTFSISIWLKGARKYHYYSYNLTLAQTLEFLKLHGGGITLQMGYCKSLLQQAFTWNLKPNLARPSQVPLVDLSLQISQIANTSLQLPTRGEQIFQMKTLLHAETVFKIDPFQIFACWNFLNKLPHVLQGSIAFHVEMRNVIQSL